MDTFSVVWILMGWCFSWRNIHCIGTVWNRNITFMEDNIRKWNHALQRKKNKQMFWGSLISPYCHIYASLNPVSIGSGNGLSPEQRQAITGTNADLLSIGPLGTNFSEIVIKIPKFSFMKMPLKMLSAKRRPFCPGGRWVKKAEMREVPCMDGSISGLILGLCPANERRCYKVTPSLIGWAQT